MIVYAPSFALATISLHHYLVLGAILFASGVVTILTKRNAIGILIGVELILNAANLNLVAFNRFAPVDSQHMHLDGQIFALFIILIAAAEAAVALAIFLNYYHGFATIDVERAHELKG